MRHRTSGLPVVLTLAALVVAGVLLDGTFSQGPRAPLALAGGLIGIGLAGALARIGRGGREPERSGARPAAPQSVQPSEDSADASAPAASPTGTTDAAKSRGQEADTELLLSVAARQLPLVDRVLAVLDELEESESDAGHLAGLFVLDELVTRMRRDAEVLLILGGRSCESSAQAAPLLGIMRAALSEVSSYRAATLESCPAVAIRAEYAAPLSHLIAEVIDAAGGEEEAPLPLEAQLDGERLTVSLTRTERQPDLAVAEALAAAVQARLEVTSRGRILLHLPVDALLAEPAPTGPTPHALDTLRPESAVAPATGERPVARVGPGGQRLVARPARRLIQERER